MFRVCSVVASLALASSALANNPWATRVVSYGAGSTPAPGYSAPCAALGAPERFTGESVFPAVVSPFNPAWGGDELVSIGEGGHLTLRLGLRGRNAIANPFGSDLIIFGNGGCIDDDYPNGRTTANAAMFGLDTALLEVSRDGVTFVSLGAFTEGLFPALGYLDAAPDAVVPGNLPADFRRPMNPALVQSSFASLEYAQLLSLYNGAAGGTPIDIAASGLDFIRYLRISVPDDGDAGTSLNAEIEAVTVVPAPGAAISLVIVGFLGAAGRRR